MIFNEQATGDSTPLDIHFGPSSIKDWCAQDPDIDFSAVPDNFFEEALNDVWNGDIWDELIDLLDRIYYDIAMKAYKASVENEAGEIA